MEPNKILSNISWNIGEPLDQAEYYSSGEFYPLDSVALQRLNRVLVHPVTKKMIVYGLPPDGSPQYITDTRWISEGLVLKSLNKYFRAYASKNGGLMHSPGRNEDIWGDWELFLGLQERADGAWNIILQSGRNEESA